METTQILQRLKQDGKLDEIWLAISLAKINSLIHKKVGANLIEQEALNPTLTRQLLELSLEEISEALITHIQARN